MKFTVDIPLPDVATAGELYSILDSGQNTGSIPIDAQLSIVLTSTGGERNDPIRQVPSAIRFTWEL